MLMILCVCVVARTSAAQGGEGEEKGASHGTQIPQAVTRCLRGSQVPHLRPGTFTIRKGGIHVLRSCVMRPARQVLFGRRDGRRGRWSVVVAGHTDRLFVSRPLGCVDGGEDGK